MKGVHILISGRVQGVFFRAKTRAVANSLGVVGFVRNLENGMVEVVAEGSGERLKKLVEFCRRGPLLAGVESIDIRYTAASGKFNEFCILH